MCEIVASPQRELEASLEIEESNGAMLVFLSDDARRLEPEAVAVEGHGTFEVVDSDSEH
jgi:hypothetical protein